VAGCFENGDERFAPIKGKRFLDKLSEGLCKEDSAPWSWRDQEGVY
jgi:hypothetical protein